MAGGEDQAEQIVAEVVVEGRGRIGLLAQHLDAARQLLVLLRRELVAAEEIDGAALGDRHEPGAGLVRDALLRPLI